MEECALPAGHGSVVHRRSTEATFRFQRRWHAHMTKSKDKNPHNFRDKSNSINIYPI